MTREEYDTLIRIPDKAMSGKKVAVRDGCCLRVSPAMFDLLAHEKGKSLEKLLAAIQVVRMTSQRKTER